MAEKKGLLDGLINAVTNRDELAAAEAAKKEAEAARARAEQEAAQRQEAEARAAAAEAELQAARTQAEQEAAQRREADANANAEAAAQAESLRQELAAEKAARREEQAAAAKARTYVIKSGDSLSKIAKEIYGDAKRWPEIFEANKDKIKDPNLIYPGQELRIP
jgi:nucleoid-associated protein YgaU